MVLKQTVFLAMLWSGVGGLLAGCAVSDEGLGEEPSTDPIDYQMQSKPLDNRVDADSQTASRLDRERGEQPGEAPVASGGADTETVGSIPDDAEASSATGTPAAERVEDYRLGTDDLLDIRVFGVDELSQKVRVNSRGYIALPLIGDVQVAGLLPEEVEKVVAQKLAQDYLQDPVVNVFVEEYASQRVTIGGAVGKSGVYALRGPTTLLQAVAMAGGLGPLALTEVNIIRVSPNGKKTKMTFDINDIQSGTIDDPPIQAGDYIIVDKSGARTFLRDSLFRDIADFFNPFRLIQ